MKDSFEKPSQEVEPEKKRFPQIEELKAPLESIFDQLAKGIESGEWYDLVIGDDASGRIPALIVSGVLKEIAEARGLENPDTLFFAGARSHGFMDRAKERREKIRGELGQLAEYKGREFKRALLVTDTLETGDTIKDIADALLEAEIQFNVIAAGHVGSETRRAWLEEKLGGRVLSPEGDFPSIPSVYGAYTLGGVEKVDNTAIHAPPMRKTGKYPPFSLQETINEARADSKEIAHEIAEKYLAEHPQKTAGKKGV